jgi:hypothetical protein
MEDDAVGSAQFAAVAGAKLQLVIIAVGVLLTAGVDRGGIVIVGHWGEERVTGGTVGGDVDPVSGDGTGVLG